MKILHVIDTLWIGGAQTVVKGIFEAQKKNKNIYLYALRKTIPKIKINHTNVYTFNSEKRYSLKPLRQLIELIEKEKIEVLHCHLFRSQVFGYILKKKYFPNIRLIFHEHGEIFQNKFVYNKFMKISKNKVNLFIAVSNITKNNLIRKIGISPEKITVLYNFVDLDKFNGKKNDRSKKRSSELKIGFVGRLNKVKGCIFLIEALNKLKIPYNCTIVGDGPEKKYLESIIKEKKLTDKIIFHGYEPEVNKIYPELDILVIPSIHESFGMTAIEAQASKVPVIASDIEGLKEVIEDGKTGILFKKENSNDLKRKLELIYNNPSLRKRLINNAIKSVKKYSLNNFLKELNLILKYKL